MLCYNLLYHHCDILESIKIENGADDKLKKIQDIKTEDKIKVEEDLKNEEFSSFEMQGSFGKMELPSDESQESVSRMGVERLQITETGRVQSMDSDDSIHLEINEKSMSESRDSEDSIMNQMSPISQGRLTPDIIEEEKVDKLEKEEKKPLTFIGRIPKIKREDSEPLKCSKKEETAKCDKLDVKNIYSSDESDSSKSYGKSDSDDKKSKDKKKDEKKFQKNEKSHRSDMEKRRKEDDNRKSFKEKDRDKKSREEKSKESNSKERKREKSKDRSHNIKKSSSSSCSSSSREKSSGHHRSSHQSRHKDPKSKEGSHDKKRKEDEKKKSKSTDDHGKERNKKDDRRSTDRDSKERDRSSGSRSQGESRKREREQKTEDYRGQKTQKDEAAAEGEVEFMPESEEIVIEMEGDWVPEGEEIVLVNEDWICSQDMIQETDVKSSFEDMKILIRKNLSDESVSEREAVLDFIELAQVGALTKIDFPKLTDDFYVKFNSTGFKYFEEWEKCKLDCEEEFKEFVDEAENDLALISDDGSDPESEFNFEEENRKTISNLLKGLSNFKKSLMFDPFTSQFYRWTNSRFYQKFRKKNEKNWWRNAEKNESDESIKENIDRVKVNCQDFDCQKDKNKENLAREKKALLHLKLLNRYKRRAIRQGKQRRRHRRKGLREGIKEKNENSHTLTTVQKNLINFQSEDGCLFRSDVRSKSETETSFLGTNMSGRMSNSAVRKDNVMNKFNFSLVEVVPEVSNASPVENGKSKPEPDTYETTVQEMVSNAYEFQSKNGVNNLHLDGEFTRVCDNRLQVVAPSLMTMLPDSPEDIKAVDTQVSQRGFADKSVSVK